MVNDKGVFTLVDKIYYRELKLFCVDIDKVTIYFCARSITHAHSADLLNYL